MTYEDGTSEKLERMRRDIVGDGPRYRPNTTPDPYDQAKHRADVLQGKDKEGWDHWRKVMSFHGFVWLEPQQLNVVVGPLQVTIKGTNGTAYARCSHKVGQWRRPPKPTKEWALAFTMDDLYTGFVGPEDFDTWIRRKDDMLRAKAQGHLIMPDSLRRPKYGGAPSVVSQGIIVNDTPRPENRPNQATRASPPTTPEGD